MDHIIPCVHNIFKSDREHQSNQKRSGRSDRQRSHKRDFHAGSKEEYLPKWSVISSRGPDTDIPPGLSLMHIYRGKPLSLYDCIDFWIAEYSVCFRVYCEYFQDSLMYIWQDRLREKIIYQHSWKMSNVG